MTAPAETPATDATSTARYHWIITLQSAESPGTSKGTIAGVNTFPATAGRGGIFNWALRNASEKLAVSDPAFRDGAVVVLFFSLEPDQLEMS